MPLHHFGRRMCRPPGYGSRRFPSLEGFRDLIVSSDSTVRKSCPTIHKVCMTLCYSIPSGDLSESRRSSFLRLERVSDDRADSWSLWRPRLRLLVRWRRRNAVPVGEAVRDGQCSLRSRRSWFISSIWLVGDLRAAGDELREGSEQGDIARVLDLPRSVLDSSGRRDLVLAVLDKLRDLLRPRDTS